MFGLGRKQDQEQPPKVRADSSRLSWHWSDLVSADGHLLRVDFSATVTILTSPAEMTMFHEVFGEVVPGAQWGTITSHLDGPLRHAAAAVAGKMAVDAALSESARPQWSDTLQQEATGTAFSCGLQVLGPFSVGVSSPSLAAARAERVRRQAVDQRAADRVQEMKQANALLGEWEQLRRSSPAASPGQLLSHLPAESRGEVLRSLLLADRTPPAPLWCVAGSNLVRIDPSADSPVATLVPLPAEVAAVGPLRSVTANDQGLLLGGQRGVVRFEAGRTSVYLHPQLQSEHGFTRTGLRQDAVWAVHRDVGLVRWKTEDPARPQRVWSPAELGGVPRHLVPEGEGFAFAIDQRLLWVDHRLEPRDVATMSSPVAALLETSGRIIAVSCDGNVSVFDGHDFKLQHTFDTGVGVVASAALLPWLSSARLLIAAAEGPILSVGIDDEVLTRFGGTQANFRTVAGSAGIVAGLSPDRQRVVLWHAWDGRKPVVEVHVAGATRHRIADFCFGAEPVLV